MGLERTIHFPSGRVPSWPDIAVKLSQLGETPVLRMIDGLPAFPDEEPDPDWRELRVGLAGEMVTLRKEDGALRCVVWGTGGAGLQAAWEHCCEAAAAAGGGQIT